MKSGIPWLSLAVALAAFVVEGAAEELREGKFRVRFRECPTCEMRIRVSPEASIAFVNSSRVGAADRAAVASRAFAVLRLADEAARALAAEGAGEDAAAAKALAEAPRLCGVGEWREASRPSTNAVARFRRAAGGGGAVFLVLRNGGEKPVGFDIPFAALGLDGRVAVLDLVEMAELDLDAKSLKVEAPPSGERKFCLVAWPAAGGAEEGRGGAG
jgi:hypothetical protein